MFEEVIEGELPSKFTEKVIETACPFNVPKNGEV
jgi:hypothetical protein